MGSLPEDVEYSAFSHHVNVLQSVLDESISAENAIIRSYKNSFNGFAAKLTEKEREKLSSLEGVVSVFPDGKLKLQTTRSWDFVGLPEKVQRSKTFESNIIIGVIDSGIWPESESFSDEGFGPIPRKWKGHCPKSFPCNKKLIGARSFLGSSDGTKEPRDFVGHGTHTASTAAGNVIHGANFYGVAKGSARGAVPSSRIAVYQVCDEDECSDSGILSGFDNAIKDGVDLITISIGSSISRDFYEDSIAIGAFHALERGILTVHAAGNNGDYAGSVNSVAPWLFSVAASSIDRHFVSKTILGNGKTLIGNGINPDALQQNNYTLVHGKESTSNCSEEYGRLCVAGCLDRNLVKGKIVICEFTTGVDEAIRAGAIGSIIKTQLTNVSFIHPLPTSALEPNEFSEVQDYYDFQSKSPHGTIHKTEEIYDSAAPKVATFSSRGPNQIAPDILKPDISAPGVDILAAFSPKAPLTSNPAYKRSANYSILSGTSMSCPHVAGASAYVKSFRPTWSASAIKSALMTTAWPMSPAKNPDGEFAYGSGQIDPIKAVKPGLVYETDIYEYVSFFCKIGYDAAKIKLIVGNKTAASACSKSSNNTSPADLNYPSLSAKVDLVKPFIVNFHRTVTNVGKANSTYRALIKSNPKIKVTVQPQILSFKSLRRKKSFNVTVEGKGVKYGSSLTASLTWFDGFHRVRSPIVVYQY